MIIDERMSAFIDSLDSGNPAWLNEIEKFALETQVPIIRRSMQISCRISYACCPLADC